VNEKGLSDGLSAQLRSRHLYKRGGKRLLRKIKKNGNLVFVSGGGLKEIERGMTSCLNMIKKKRKNDHWTRFSG